MRENLDPQTHDRKVEVLWDTHVIQALLIRYCRAFDRRDVDDAKATHWPDAMVDYPNFRGLAGAMCESADAIHGSQFASTQHYVTNTLIELDGDTAHTETYFIMAGLAKDSALTVMIGGRYIRRLERRHGEWRIAACVCLAEWSSEDQTTAQLLEISARAARDASDWAYHRPLEVLRTATSEQPALDIAHR